MKALGDDWQITLPIKQWLASEDKIDTRSCSNACSGGK